VIVKAKQTFDPRLALLVSTLKQHQILLGELSDDLTARLTHHSVLLHAVYAFAKAVALEKPVPADIVAKLDHGAGVGDIESHDAEQRAYRARHMITWIKKILIEAEQDPNGKYILNDLESLDQIAQFEFKRCATSLVQLKQRNIFLEEWVLRLSPDPKNGTDGSPRFH
jgi:hypothetical protein